ncbi:LexA family transcriptional regulator [Kiloniella laminariae]|uniref:LexA family transcriptional regulator n=1 Tax=Kiloniella laminariae TaxID=454162 RepID=A0ABT4LF99_9PROT|nr:LexA family transcriptional regulator [Kiloniella laminariae]MCZ4279782.1 LexA family transcriptional regulator [Kiloniella laminariae]
MDNRIKELRLAKGLTLQQVADKAGTTKAQVMKLEKGDRRLTDLWMVRLSIALACDPKELMDTSRASRHLPARDSRGDQLDDELDSHEEETGRSSAGSRKTDPNRKHPSGSGSSGSGSSGSGTRQRPPKGSDSVAEIDVRGGMGGGGEAGVAYHPDGKGDVSIADDIRGNWSLPSEYLRTELHVQPTAARIIEVQGDSMTPTLVSGDRVMIDINDQRPTPPGIFALWDGFGVVVKRIEHIPNTDPPLLRISSDNANHAEYQRTFDEVNIIGRVIWYGRRM